MHKPPPFHFLTPVWGQEYVRFFLESSLPSLFSKKNLPSLVHKEDCLFHILTFADDIERIKAHPSVSMLKSIMPVLIEQMDQRGATIHDTMSIVLKNGIYRADQKGAASLFFNPDFIYADGAVSSLSSIAAEGKRAIFGSAPRMRKETSEDQILSRYNVDGVTTVEDRDLVQAVIDHMHPICHQHLWLEGDDPLIPANLIWRVKDQGLLLHCFHLHPFLVWPRHKNAEFSGTVDDDFVLFAAPDSRDRHIIDSSDGFFVAEVSTNARQVSSSCRKGDINGIVEWAEMATSDLHRELIKKPICLYTQTPEPKVWASALNDAEAMIFDVQKLLDTPIKKLIWRHPIRALKRIVRLSRERNMKARNKLNSRSIWSELTTVFFEAYSSFCARYERTRTKFSRFLFGTDKKPMLTHPRWLFTHCALGEFADQITNSAQFDSPIVILNNDEQLEDRFKTLFPNARIISPPELRMAIGASPKSAPERDIGSAYDMIIAADIGQYIKHRTNLLDDLRNRLAEQGTMIFLPGLLTPNTPDTQVHGDVTPMTLDGSVHFRRGTKIGLGLMAFLESFSQKIRPSPVIFEIAFVPIILPVFALCMAVLNIFFAFLNTLDRSGEQ